MDAQLFKSELKERLTQPLPGVDAQIRMAPKPVNPKRFKEDPLVPAKPSGVMALLYPHEGDIYLPLMKRPTYDGAHSGQISLPGGKMESTDHDLVATALRETEEEIGVDQSDIEVLGQLSDLFIIVSNFKVTPTVGFIESKPSFIPDPHEVAGVLNISLDALNNADNQGIERMSFRNNVVINSPYYNVHGNVVWGATAMILSELLAVTAPILGSQR